MQPKISVILPVYNGEKFLAKCFEYLLAQTLRELEIICINDGSADGTGEILDRFAKRDSRIAMINTQNQGAGMARNIGISKARGEFIAFLDADDRFYTTNTLETLYNSAKTHNAKICGGSMAFAYPFGAENTKEFCGFYFDDLLRDKSKGFIEYKVYQFDYGFTRFIYARDLVCNIVFPAFTRFEDPPFFVESMIKTKRFYALKIPSYFCYNQNKDLSKEAILSAFSGIKLNTEIAKRYKLSKLLDFTKYRFDEHYDKFLSAGGSEREIYEVFAKAPKIWQMLTSPRNKRWCEKI
ncbi:glycosyltransferase family 2 protein [Helicobacter sp. T3_23-1059]